ncbi:MAG: hypothetical protein CSA33_07990 [Desulfobulbus propionicus]|nr:MAG: hypothetical protein CSA33_07990 [Desulfobulbus propionicus]
MMGESMQGRIRLICKISIVVVWVGLVVGLLRRDVFITSITADERALLSQAENEVYQAIYFKHAKIGYVINQYDARGDTTLRINQQAVMRLQVAEMEQRIVLRLQADVLADNSLKNFTFSFDSPFYRMQARGTVTGKIVAFELQTGSATIRNQVVVDRPPVLPTARRGYLLRGEIQPGDKVRLPSFDPLRLTAKETVIVYKGRDKVLINGRVLQLHKFTEMFSGVGINFWLNDTGDVVKEESPAGFVFVKEPKFKALAMGKGGEELFSSVSVTGDMPDLTGCKRMQYRLGLPEGTFELSGGRQRFADPILTVTMETVRKTDASAGCGDMRGACQATAYVQAHAPRIVALAEKIIAGEEDAVQQVRKLSTWVHENIEKRPVIGYPDALSTLDARIGDCNEHAALFAALARSIGIPTYIAAGVVHHKDAFYYHAWNEVCVNNMLLSLDTTTNQVPADLTHLRFLRGEFDEQVQVGALLGRLSIEPLPEKRCID